MLSYDQLPEAVAAPRSSAPPAGAAFSLLDLVLLLWRRRLVILGAGIACALAALVVGKSLTPKYVATAQLYVDPRELQLVDRELAPRTQDAANLPMIVESQARLIASSSVLLRVVDSARLVDDPEFGGGQPAGLLSALTRLVAVGGPGGAVRDPRIAALEALVRHISVKRTDRTFIVDVDVWSLDPVKAAKLANAVAAAYLAEASSVQSSSARRATTDLSARLAELEQRLRNAENAVAAYKAEHNFVGTQDTSVTDQQLSDMNAKLAAARAATLDAQARYDQINDTIRASGDGGATSEALRSPTLAGLRTQYAEARRRQAELANELGPRHPAIRSMDTQVADLKKNINEEVARFAQAAKNDLTRARDYESGLARALEGLKRQSMNMSQAAVRLRELERDVEANRAVYQSFLKRSRETEEQERLNTSTARITTEANIPQRRSFPPSMALLMIAGLLFGSGGSAAAIVVLDRLRAFARPAPLAHGDVSEAVAVAEQAAPAVAAPRESAALPHVMLKQEVPPAAPALPPMDKPLIMRLQSEEVYPRNADSPGQGAVDLNRIGWPTLRIGGPPGAFAEAMREIRVAAASRTSIHHAPVLAVIGMRDDASRSVTALNAALAAAHDGFDVLLIDSDLPHGGLSRRLQPFRALRDITVPTPSGLGSPVETLNRVTVLPLGSGAEPEVMAEAERMIAEHARVTTECGLIILDGPAAPFAAWDRSVMEIADGLLAALPAHLDINAAMEDLLTALGSDAGKLLGVVINEIDGPGAGLLQEREYA